ncbi:MAG: hypothetical protein LUG86_02025 [Oscillospiraceae bacterium]|nr:hypothetical protein [Oscillospiraceae bacterium]
MQKVKNLIAIGLVFVVVIIAAVAILFYDRIEEVSEPEQVVDGVNYLLSSETIMKSGSSTELLCSYSLEPLSDDVYILKISLYQNESDDSYVLKNMQASVQIPGDIVCRMASCSNGEEISEPTVSYNENGAVINCTGGNRLEAEILITGEIASQITVEATYDVAGKIFSLFPRFLDECVTFKLTF